MRINLSTEAGYPEQSTLDVSGLSFTGRIARWSASHRWWVIAASALVFILALIVLNTVSAVTNDGDAAVGEAATGADLLYEQFGDQGVLNEQLVFSNPSLDANDPRFKAKVEELAFNLRALPGVGSVSTFYDTGDPAMVSEDGRVVLASVELSDDSDRSIDQVLDTVKASQDEAAGFEIGIAGNATLERQLDKIVEEDFSRIFLVSIVIGLIILLIAFRAVVAAVIPLVMAVGSIFTAIAVATLFSHAYSLVDFYTEMILLMGLAVGIDYSLFIISRFRNERADGRERLDAISVASSTTGRAVFYAGVTVLLSLAGLTLTYNPIFISLALGAIFVVTIAVIASLTLLPALLSVLGDNVNRLRVPFFGQGNNGGGIWGAITDKVLAKPAVLATVTTVLLISLAAPVVTLDLGFNSGSNALPDDVDGKRAVELLEEHFTLGLAQPALVVVDHPDVTSPEVQSGVSALLRLVEENEAFVGPFEIGVSESGTLLFVQVPLVGAIDGEQAEDAVRVLRDELIPQALGRSLAEVHVTGFTPAVMDFRENMYDSVPYVFGFVLGLAFLLLLVMFRSIVIPIKAIVLNILSVGAAYGVLVMVFQWGWGVGLLGSEKSDVIEAWLPLFLFGILFGLSMDYHMLLLNRIKEAYDKGLSNEESVSYGIKVTAGQITSAAAVMVGVFGAFALSRTMDLQQFGVGLGVAVLIDATVIRTILLPASMKLLGDRNWYLPSWLNWLPKFGPDEPGRSQALPASGSNVGFPSYQPSPEPVPIRIDE